MVKAAPRVISTVAGTGQVGYNGDAGPATKAEFDDAHGVAVDSSGNLYIADAQANVVREVFAPASAPAAVPTSTMTSAPTPQPTPGQNRSETQGHPARPLPGQILTIAGVAHVAGYSGDGGLATRSPLNNPTGLTVDAAGNIYIADTSSNRVREVPAASAVIRTVAGTGAKGFGGDGGPATKATLSAPQGLVLDGAGNLYILDSGNHRVREVHAGSGLITTVAGGGRGSGGVQLGAPATAVYLQGPNALAIDRAGSLYIADPPQGDAVLKVSLLRHTVTAILHEHRVAAPQGLAVDGAGNIDVIDEVDDGATVSGTLAGTGPITIGHGPVAFGCAGDGDRAVSAGLIKPTGLALDRAGNLFIVDQSCATVREVFAGSGLIATVAGVGYADYRGGYDVNNGGFLKASNGGFSGDGGPAVQAELYQPSAVAFDGAGNLYIADSGNNVVREVGTPLQTVSPTIVSIAGTGKAGADNWAVPAVKKPLDGPRSVAVDRDGNVYIADTLNNRVCELHVVTGLLTIVAGSRYGAATAGYRGDGGPATKALLNTPVGVAVDDQGNVYIADTGNNVIREVDSSTGIITTFAGIGVAGFSGDGGRASSAELDGPRGVAVDIGRNVYIADSGNNRVREVTLAHSTIATVAGNGMAGFGGDGGPAAQAELRGPEGLALQPSFLSQAAYLYIADTGNNVIRRVSLRGTPTISTVAGDGTQSDTGNGGSAGRARLNQPRGVALDNADNLYIAEAGNNAVRVVASKPGTLLVDNTSTITRLAGTGTAGVAEGAGPAAHAQLDQPFGLATSFVYRGSNLPPGGNIYVADTGNNVVREIVPPEG